MSARPFAYSHRVTYAECTVGNHVYYGRYLDILEAARGAFFRHLDMSFLDWQEKDTIFPVIECRLSYKSAARYDDVLTVAVWPTAVQSVRLAFGYRVSTEAGTLVLEAETFHVCTGLNGRPKRLPEALSANLQSRLPAKAGDQPGGAI